MELKAEIAKLVDVAHPSGPFFLGLQISFVDIQMAPWVVRMRKVLKPYRGWPDPEPGSRWASWVDAIEKDPGVRATTSADDLYIDSYERYAGESSRCQSSAVGVLIDKLIRESARHQSACNCGKCRPRSAITLHIGQQWIVRCKRKKVTKSVGCCTRYLVWS